MASLIMAPVEMVAMEVAEVAVVPTLNLGTMFIMLLFTNAHKLAEKVEKVVKAELEDMAVLSFIIERRKYVDSR